MDAPGQVSAPEFSLERRLAALESDLRLALDLIANLQSEHASLTLEIS